MRQRAFAIEIDDKVIFDTSESGVNLSANNITSKGVQPRVEFEIAIDALGHITYCDLSVSNLTEETINKSFKKNAILKFKCGYEDNIDYVFNGMIRNVFRFRDGATTITQIIARAGKLKKKNVNIALGENAKLNEIIKALVDSMGYSLVISKDDFKDISPTGYSMTGSPEDYLSKLARAYKFNWTVDRDKVIVFKAEAGRKGGRRKVINMLSGLEGIPEITEVGADFSVRMDPSIKIGSIIELDTKYKSFNFANVYYPTPLQDVSGSGKYTVMKITYSGDNYSQSTWSTKCQCYKSNIVTVN